MEICKSSWDLYWEEYEERKARENEQEQEQEEKDWVFEAILKEQKKEKK